GLVLLAHDPTAEVREAVAVALGHLAVTAAAAPSRKRRIHLVPSRWRAWLVDWHRAAPETVVINPIAVIVATLRGALGDASSAVRVEAAAALGRLGSAAAEAAPALIAALADHNDQVRGRAAEALGKLGEAAADVAVPGLVRALRDRDNWVSALAAEALGEMGDAADGAVPSLVHALRHMNPQ